VSDGHALVIPRRHVASFFDTTPEERQAMFDLLDEAKTLLDRAHRPDGYNLGINNGQAAGQSVMHVHLHVIPRYRGDKDDPRGGVRWVLPEKAVYKRKE
jgi:diadenosine tetraphosphate (Ap4A) HIT family hydrolase